MVMTVAWSFGGKSIIVQFSEIIEALAKPGRGNVLVARVAANRGQRGRCPSLARGFASTSINYGYVKRSGAPWAMGQVTLTENFPDRTVWWGTQTISSLICENKCGFVEPLSYVPFVAKMS